MGSGSALLGRETVCIFGYYLALTADGVMEKKVRERGFMEGRDQRGRRSKELGFEDEGKGDGNGNVRT